MTQSLKVLVNSKPWENWDSLWDRVTENVDTDIVEDKEDFKQKMVTDFFKGKFNPSGDKGKGKLIDSLWDYGIDNDYFPKVIEVGEEENEEIENEIIEATKESITYYIQKNADLTVDEKEGLERQAKEQLEDARKDILKDVTKDIMGERDKDLSKSTRKAIIKDVMSSIMKDIEANIRDETNKIIEERRAVLREQSIEEEIIEEVSRTGITVQSVEQSIMEERAVSEKYIIPYGSSRRMTESAYQQAFGE